MKIPHIKDYCDKTLPANGRLIMNWTGLPPDTLIYVVRTEHGYSAVPIKDPVSLSKPIDVSEFVRLDPSELTDEYDICSEILVIKESLSFESCPSDGILPRLVPCPGKPYLYRVEVALDTSIIREGTSYGLSDRTLQRIADMAGYLMLSSTLTNYIPKRIVALPRNYTVFGKTYSLDTIEGYRERLFIARKEVA